MRTDLDAFLRAWTGDADVPDELRARLLHRIEADHAFRAECVAELRLLGMLEAVQCPMPRWLAINDALGISAGPPAKSSQAAFTGTVMARVRHEIAASPRPGGRRLRSFAVAAMGLVVGMLCSSAVLGYAVRPKRRPIALIAESFESGPAPAVRGVPAGPGHWSGDYTELVGEGQGVTPAQGRRMLRYLRSDYDGSSGLLPRRSGDIMQVFDVRQFSSAIEAGEVLVSLSAVFNAAAFPTDERYGGIVSAFALESGIDLVNATEDIVKHESLAFSSGDSRSLDRDPATWQTATTRLLLPPATAFVMLRVSVRRLPSDTDGEASLPATVSFASHYVDDVRASLIVGDPGLPRLKDRLP